MSRGIGFYLDLMDLISDGSVTLELDRECKIASVTVEREEILVDLGIPGLAYDLLQPMLRVEDEKGKEVRGVKRGGKWKSNTLMVRKFLQLFQGLENEFTERGKKLRVQYKGTDVVVMGGKKRSLMARMVGLRHVSLPHKLRLITLVKDFWLSKPEPDVCDLPPEKRPGAPKALHKEERPKNIKKGGATPGKAKAPRKSRVRK